MSSEKPTILIIEDDDSVRNLLKMTLSMDGYGTILARDGIEGEKKIEEGGFALVLLDIMLPGKDGYSLLPLCRAKNVPVIFLTAKGTVSDKVLGLKSGADDYITKPFEPVELLARVEAVLRRVSENSGSSKKELTYKDIFLDENAHSVTKAGKKIVLTEKEFELLDFFFNNVGQAFEREQLLDNVWGYDYYGGTRTVDVHVSSLRNKLSLTDDIETVYKLGYRLRREV